MGDSKFNTGEPLGYFITWTCYGTWLPGDDRGWNRKGDVDSCRPNELFLEMATLQLKEAPFDLNPTDREIVEDTIHKHCGIRGWELHTVNARSNHLHVVVTAPGYRPETVRDQLKAWCTRKLKPNHSKRKNYWTKGASRRYLNTQEELDSAIKYVNEAQDRKGVEQE